MSRAVEHAHTAQLPRSVYSVKLRIVNVADAIPSVHKFPTLSAAKIACQAIQDFRIYSSARRARREGWASEMGREGKLLEWDNPRNNPDVWVADPSNRAFVFIIVREEINERVSMYGITND